MSNESQEAQAMSEEQQAEKTQRDKRFNSLVDKIIELDARGAPRASIEFMASWMADVEAKHREHDKKLRSFGDWKESVLEHVTKMKEIESRIETQINGIGEACNAALNEIAGHVQMVHKGLNQLEGRVHAMWNTLNTTIHFVVSIISGEHSFPATAIGEKEQTPLGRFKFTEKKEKVHELFIAAGRALFKEAQEHQAKEFARMKAEKTAGKQPAPMAPHTGAFATTLVGDHIDMLRENGEAVKKHVKEMEGDDAGRKE